nr:hypothetical protein [Candidatus Filomicrobium marinum]
MGHQITGKAADIVDDDDMAMVALVLPQKPQHGLHAGAVNQSAGDTLIGKDLDDLIAPVPGIFAAAGFLRAKAGAARHLFGV